MVGGHQNTRSLSQQRANMTTLRVLEIIYYLYEIVVVEKSMRAINAQSVESFAMENIHKN